MTIIINILAVIGAINLGVFIALLIFFYFSLKGDKSVVYADPIEDMGTLVEQESEVDNDGYNI